MSAKKAESKDIEYQPGDIGKKIGKAKHLSSSVLPFAGLFEGVSRPSGRLVVSTSAPLPPPVSDEAAKGTGSVSASDRHAVSGDAAASGALGKKPGARNRKKKERASDPERDQRTLFISNLPVTYSQKQLSRLCSEYGLISSVRFRSVAISSAEKSRKVAVMKREYDTERNVKNGYVVFCEEDGVQKALALQNRVIEGRHIRVDVASGSGHDYKSSVFVGHLPPKADEESVRAFFEENCAPVVSVRLIRDSNGVGKGFGYVRFVESSSVLLALKCHQSEFQGRQIRVFKARKNFTSTQAKPEDKSRRSFAGEYAKKGDKKAKNFQRPAGSGKPKQKKQNKKSQQVKQMKKEKRMQNIEKRSAAKSRVKPKQS
ncbi:RNA-binding protein 34-like [Sycon ciliatum]|uniref:RNA-binding protein 34-like n=1 Tax=Sycon ciliatum TaxID=27933 RepID=UPI0020AD7C1B|eukprot:scpid60257/ scgid15486/ RNA-binding protein 34; RNA-binding motif protein 34